MKTKTLTLTLLAFSLIAFMSCQKSEEESGSTSCGNDGHIPIGFWTAEPINSDSDIKLYVNGECLGKLQTANAKNDVVSCSDPNIIWCHLPGDHYTIKVVNEKGDVFVQAKVGFSCQRGTIGIVSLDKGSLGAMLEHNERPGCPKSNQISLIFDHKSEGK